MSCKHEIDISPVKDSQGAKFYFCKKCPNQYEKSQLVVLTKDQDKLRNAVKRKANLLIKDENVRYLIFEGAITNPSSAKRRYRELKKALGAYEGTEV